LDGVLTGLLVGIVLSVAVGVTWRLSRRRPRAGARDAEVTYQSFITSMRAVGELNVFRIMTKEVMTASDHWFGEFGRKYLQWLLSEQRVTLVIEFDIDFRYDLGDPRFQVERTGDRSFRMVLPPCRHEVRIRDLKYHSEDKPELLPWLVPDLLGRFFTGGFSIEAKNKLIDETRQQTSRMAGDLVARTTAEAQASAQRTLTMLAQGLGAWQVEFEFLPSGEFRPRVDSTQLEKHLPLPGPAAEQQPREG
jgi:hypothetical protein